MLPRVGNLLPWPRNSSESTHYFFLGFTASISTPTCISLSSWNCNWFDHQALDINLEIGNSKYAWKQTPLHLTRDSHTQHKEQPQNVARVFPFILKTKHKTLHIRPGLGWFGKFCKKTICTSINRLSLILDRSSQTDLHSKSYKILNSNFTHKHTLSKSKVRLKRFDHGLPTLQNEVLIH